MAAPLIPNLSDLAALTLPADAEEVLGLPDPSDDWFVNEAVDDLRPAACAFARMMLSTVLDRPGAEGSLESDALRAGMSSDAYFTLGAKIAHYFYLLAFALLEKPAIDELWAALRITRDRLLADDPRLPGTALKPLSLEPVGFQGILLLSLLAVFIGDRINPVAGSKFVPAGVQEILIDGLGAISSGLGLLEKSEQILSLRLLLLSRGLTQLKKLMFELPYEPAGLFSSLDLYELERLAARSEEMIRKYGEHRVEKKFEQQLALLMQSFGFYVVQTRTGTRQVDLVCISSYPNEQYTVLLEAKSTRKPYALPASDQRALSDYAEDVRKLLVTLPPLRIVLLAGPSATRTVEAKLNLLEGELGTPVRFITAAQLVNLRDLLPGPAPAAAFRDLALHAEKRVLADDFPQSVATAFERRQEAHVKFVESLLVSRYR